MPEIGTLRSTSGERKRSVAAWPKPPRLSSTLQLLLERRARVEQAYSEALLRARRWRPNQRHAADKRDELPPPHLTVAQRSEISRRLMAFQEIAVTMAIGETGKISALKAAVKASAGRCPVYP